MDFAGVEKGDLYRGILEGIHDSFIPWGNEIIYASLRLLRFS